MKVLKKPLLAALAEPTRITQSKIGRGVAHLHLSANDVGMRIEAFDGDQACAERLECNGKLDEVCVPSGTFTTAVQYAGDEIEIERDEKALWFRSAGRSLRLATYPADTFHHFNPEAKLVVMPAALLADGLDRVSAMASTNESRYILKSVHVVGSATQLFCEASNGQQFASFTTPAICADFEVVMPIEFIIPLAHALRREGAELMLTENKIVVHYKGGYFACKPMEGLYPNTRPYMEAENNKLGIIARDEWLQIFKCIKSLRAVDEKSLVPVKLDFSEKSCAILGGGETMFEEEVAGNFTPRKLFVNAVSFETCLLAFPAESLVEIGELSDNNAVKLEEGDLKVLTTQLRNTE